jgi:hypothetical protein
MIQSSTMKTSHAIPVFLLCLALPLMAIDHAPPPVQPATSFAAVEVHDKEQVAIAAEPYDTKEKESIFRVDYLSHGVMPVRLIVTNLGNRPISLRDARILFETASGDRIQAAQPEDVERLMTRQEREGKKIPMPGPIQQPGNRTGLQYLRVPGAGCRAAHHARRIPVLRCLGYNAPAARRQALPEGSARCGRQRTVLLRDSLQQVPEVEVEPDELRRCCSTRSR